MECVVALQTRSTPQQYLVEQVGGGPGQHRPVEFVAPLQRRRPRPVEVGVCERVKCGGDRLGALMPNRFVRRLALEITEAVLIADDDAALASLKQLRALGVKIALDDFGTGFAALGYLISYPFDKIKIDGSVVRALDNATGAHAIVRAVSEIGYRMGIATTAEGVETEPQRMMPRASGCHDMLTSLFSPAKPAAYLRKLLFSRDTRSATAA